MQSLEESRSIPQVINYLKSLGYEYIETGIRHTEPNRAPIYIDAMVFDQQHKPLVVVEVKNDLPVEITKFHPAVDQAYRYARQIGTPYFLVTNGVNMFWYRVNKDQSGFDLMGLPPQRKRDHELHLFSMETDDVVKRLYGVVDVFRGVINTADLPAILIAFMLAKIFDEDNTLHQGSFQFQVRPDESEAVTKSRISKLFKTAVKKQGLPVDENIIDSLEPSMVQNIVEQIQPYKIKGSDIVDELIEQFRPAWRNSGNYYTPVPIRNFLSQIFDFTADSAVLDPAAGTGTFLAAVAEHMRKNKKVPTAQLVGVDKDRNAMLFSSARLSVLGVMENSQLFSEDFLSDLFQKRLRKINKEGFDFVIANPPFGSHSGRSYEAEYLSRIINILKVEGHAAVILPEGFLANPRQRENRRTLINVANIIAVISLPTTVFYPYSGVKVSAVILSKKIPDEVVSTTLFLKIPNSDQNLDEIYSNAVETCRYFIRTKRLQKSQSIQLFPVIANIDPGNGYRMDYTAYAPDYIQVVEQLRKSNSTIISLGEVADVRLGNLKNDKFPNNIPVISLHDLRNDWFLSENANAPLSQSDLFQYEDIRLKPGDLLIPSVFSSDNPVFLVPDINNVVIANRSLLVITPNQERIVSRYLFALFRHRIVKVQLERLSAGAAIRSATPRLLREIQIPLIPIQKQREIAELINQYQEAQSFAKSMLRRADEELSALFGTENEEADNENA